jgi:hypothetical protein
VLVPGLVVTTGSAAFGGCQTETYYTVSAKSVRMPFRKIPTFKDGPGGRISVSRSYSSSTSAQVILGVESEVGAVLAKAKASISGSLVRTNSTRTTHTYSRKITKGKYGHVKYVSWGKEVKYNKKMIRSNCTVRTIRSGTIRYPSTAEGWYYWETKR